MPLEPTSLRVLADNYRAGLLSTEIIVIYQVIVLSQHEHYYHQRFPDNWLQQNFYNWMHLDAKNFSKDQQTSRRFQAFPIFPNYNDCFCERTRPICTLKSDTTHTV